MGYRLNITDKVLGHLIILSALWRRFIVVIEKAPHSPRSTPSARVELVQDLSRFQTQELPLGKLNEFRCIAIDTFKANNYASSDWIDVLKQALALTVEIAAHFKCEEVEHLGVYVSIVAALAALIGVSIGHRYTQAKLAMKNELALEAMKQQERFYFGIDNRRDY